ITVGGPGTCAFMPRGVPHAWKNTGAETGRALFVYTPAQAGKWFEELKLAERPINSMDDRGSISAMVGSALDLPLSKSSRGLSCAGKGVLEELGCRTGRSR